MDPKDKINFLRKIEESVEKQEEYDKGFSEVYESRDFYYWPEGELSPKIFCIKGDKKIEKELKLFYTTEIAHKLLENEIKEKNMEFPERQRGRLKASSLNCLKTIGSDRIIPYNQIDELIEESISGFYLLERFGEEKIEENLQEIRKKLRGKEELIEKVNRKLGNYDLNLRL